MKILLLLVILWFDKSKSSPLPFDKINDSNYDASPWSPDDARPSDYLGVTLTRTTTVEFEQVNEGTTTVKNDENESYDEDVEVKLSDNGMKNKSQTNEENENSPFSHIPKTSIASVNKEVTPGNNAEENDPGKVFLVRTKRTSTHAHMLTNAPPHDKIIEDVETIKTQGFHKSHEKSDEDSDKMQDMSESTTVIPTEKSTTVTETTETVTTIMEVSDDHLTSNHPATLMKTSTEILTTTDETPETTNVANSRNIRSTNQITTVRDVLTTDGTTTKSGSRVDQPDSTNLNTVRITHPITTVRNVLTTDASIIDETTISATQPPKDDSTSTETSITKEGSTTTEEVPGTTNMANSRQIRSTDQMTTVRDVLRTTSDASNVDEITTMIMEGSSSNGPSISMRTTTEALTTTDEVPVTTIMTNSRKIRSTDQMTSVKDVLTTELGVSNDDETTMMMESTEKSSTSTIPETSIKTTTTESTKIVTSEPIKSPDQATTVRMILTTEDKDDAETTTTTITETDSTVAETTSPSLGSTTDAVELRSSTTIPTDAKDITTPIKASTTNVDSITEPISTTMETKKTRDTTLDETVTTVVYTTQNPLTTAKSIAETSISKMLDKDVPETTTQVTTSTMPATTQDTSIGTTDSASRVKFTSTESTSRVRSTYMLTAEPPKMSETPRMTTLAGETTTVVNLITSPKVTSFASTVNTLMDKSVTDSGLHEESSEMHKRSIEQTTSVTEDAVETTTIKHSKQGHEIMALEEDGEDREIKTTEAVTTMKSTNPKEVSSTRSEIPTTSTFKPRPTYILTPEEILTTLPMKETTESQMKTSSEPVTPLTSPKEVTSTTPESYSTSTTTKMRSTYILTPENVPTPLPVKGTIKDGFTTPTSSKATTTSTISDVKTSPTPNEPRTSQVSTETSTSKARTTYVLIAEPATTEQIPNETTVYTTSPKISIITHDDVTYSDHHKESTGTNKRSIDKSDANDLNPSSERTASRDDSTEKVTKTTEQVPTTEQIITNSLKDVETTLETPISKNPEPTQTTMPETTTIRMSQVTTSTAKPEFTLTTLIDTSTIRPSQATTKTEVPEPILTTMLETLTTQTRQATTSTQLPVVTTELKTEPTTSEATEVETGSVYGSKSKSEDDGTTTPKSVVETTEVNRDDHSVNHCNTAPVYSKGDTIVGGGTINDVNVHEKNHKNKSGELLHLCTSTECVHSASRMLSRMNLKVDPCTDFYEFACGTFLAETHVPSEKSSVDIFVTINDKLQQQLNVLLSAPIDKQKDIVPVQVVKTLFSACMNRDLIEERGTKPLLDLLHLLGGWPILIGDSWNGEHWTWTYTIARMKLLGVGIDYITELSVTNDFSNSSKRIVYLDQAVTELDREFLLNGWNDTNVLAYFDYIKDVAIFLGADKETADREAREIVNFEISLGHISASKESRRELQSLYNPITIRDLQHKYPYINWLEYINLLLPHKVRVTNDQIISLADKTFIKKLGPLLDNTPKRVIANYLLWHAVDASIGFLTESLQKIELRYRSKTNGNDELDPQWKECVKSIAPRFKVAIGAQYAREYFKEDSKKVAVEMVHDIKEAFAEIIQSRDWMDEDTKSAAMEKLERMSVNIAYPNELMDDSIVTEFYKGLHVKEDEYFESALRSYAFLVDKGLDRLHDPVNKTDWRDLAYVAVVNAFYHPLLNYIMFPAGILQEHFFQADRPKYMNYAAIGFVIGHEITHGFDDMGAQFDVEGNLRKWWQNDTLEAYMTRAQCIIDQYGNFTDPEVNVTLNGFATQGENIADNGGLKEAYIAYQKWVQKYGEEPGLPGLNYTSNQLFWISAAQNWCSKYKPEALKYTIITDSHSPGRFRVMGPFMNSVDFASDFECPKGSKMNPEEKCEVW